MNSIDQAFWDAILADIVYVDGMSVGMTGRFLEEAIQYRVPAPLAREIGTRFVVLAKHNEPSSDYQAAVFKDLSNGTIYVAQRGTESLKDILIADVDLVVSGIARGQTAAMVNWWQEITKPAGTSYNKIAAVSIADSGNANVFIPAGVGISTGNISSEVAAATGRNAVRVVGHSLGGHLATVLASLFADQVQQTATFNTAGLFSRVAGVNALRDLLMGDPLRQAAALIGQPIRLPHSSQDNFFAINGLNVATNEVTFVQIGTRIPVYNEYTTPGVGSSLVQNHYLYKQTDSLALFRAIEMLDPTLKLGSLIPVAESASNLQPSSLEAVLDGLRRMTLGSGVSATPAIDEGGDWETKAMPPERTAFHTNLSEWMASDIFKSMAGKTTISVLLTESAGAIADLAKTDFGIFVALDSLSSIALRPKKGEVDAPKLLDESGDLSIREVIRLGPEIKRSAKRVWVRAISVTQTSGTKTAPRCLP